MYPNSRRLFSTLLVLLSVVLLQPLALHAQQTLGGITGTVIDPSGSAVPGAEVKATSEDTKLERSTQSNAQGTYSMVDLPIGKYTVTFTLQGFSTEKVPGILVQADRTVTLPAQLAVGAVADSVEVDVNPLLNAVDTTNGYVLDRAQIENIPLPTGSFTGVAILSPGVNAELPGGTGVNSGLGNAPIWANGERDTSNSFLLNGVDASNLFNGKSTSQVASARVSPGTGVGNDAGGGVIQSSASVYLSIGNALPSPAPETIQEVRVNASMYDAQQGATSGAHIDLSTSSGTNDLPRKALCAPRHQLAQCRALLLQSGSGRACQPTRTRSCTATSWAELSAAPSSKTSSSASWPTNTCMSAMLRSAIRFSMCPSA